MASQQEPLIQTAQKQNHVAAIVPETARARVEIDEFLADNDMTNLFLLALEAMYPEDPNKSGETEDWWTFYSLGSIHGLPSELWNNVKNGNDPEGQKFSGSGYCTHGSLVFPTWHRVYIAMFEQAVANRMAAIANEYPQETRAKYQSAADRFRLPFWDPLLPRNSVPQSTAVDPTIWGLPKILGAKFVWVQRPKGSKLEHIPNPLYSFNIPSDEVLKKKGRIPIDWPKNGDEKPAVGPIGVYRTIRTPDPTGETNLDQEGPAGKEGLILKIQRQAQNTSTKLWKLLSRYNTESDNDMRTWEAFARHWKEGHRGPDLDLDTDYQADTSISLETWHDDIHDLVGAGNGWTGHMGDPSIAGFDAAFWLHHNNVDRILAIYQALYPDKWVPAEGEEATGENATSNLYPFQQDAKTFWNSNDARDWRNLGFAVPGREYLDEAGRAKLETYLHENYYWSSEASFPPPSVSSKWPKDLSGSIALNGAAGAAIPAPSALQFEALEGTKLVTRTIQLLEPKAKDTLEVVDKTKSITFKDETENPKIYPEGSLKWIDQPHITMRTWTASVLVEKYAFNGSFLVHIFIGEVDDAKPELWITKRNEVGFAGIFASSESAPCANCVKQRREGVIYEDAVPLNTSLPDYLQANVQTDGPPMEMRTLESLEPEHVVPFLKKYLHWRITDLASNPLNEPQQIKNSKLCVSVWDRDFELPTARKRLGKYLPSHVHKEVTKGKLGGFGYGEEDTVHTS
ncbi:MAG: hypothetical protein M1835_001679 [Candelina submexicana]|nr:MAG: hypothetical protein M1835_001679 [Candelina submexicana]